MTRWVFASGVLLAVGAARLAAAEVTLGPRYIDPRNGFSLRPPAGVERVRETSPSRIVRWSMRDARTGAIAWTLTVRLESGPDPGVTLKAFGDALARALGKRAGVRVESVIPARVLGTDALYVRTETGEKARRWQYDLWVLADARRFLVFSMVGPLGMKQRIEEIGRKVAGTIQLLDAKALAATRKANLERSGKLLKALTEKKLTEAVSSEPQWYLYRRGEKDVGFMHVEESFARGLFSKGLRIRSFARLELKNGQVMDIRRELFATADRATEKWSEEAVVRRGGKVAQRMSESGSLGAGTITCKLTAGGKSQTRRKPLPAPTAPYYLPRAMAFLLGRLVDLNKGAGYGFATYTTAANDYDLRTFTVIGPDKVTVSAKTVEAVRVTDQVKADAEAATMHLSSDGTLLRMETSAGITMELATRSAVLRRYPEAAKLVGGS